MADAYAAMDYWERCRECLAKVIENCSDKEIPAVVSVLRKVQAAEKKHKAKEKRIFAGFWDKLDKGFGGYVNTTTTKYEQEMKIWGRLNYEKKFARIELLDTDDDEKNPLPTIDPTPLDQKYNVGDNAYSAEDVGTSCLVSSRAVGSSSLLQAPSPILSRSETYLPSRSVRG